MTCDFYDIFDDEKNDRDNDVQKRGGEGQLPKKPEALKQFGKKTAR